jgi:hypothetical protein
MLLSDWLACAHGGPHRSDEEGYVHMDFKRFCFGGMVCLAAGLLLATFNMIPGYDCMPYGHVSGHVTYNGRPMTGGTVMFVRDGEDHELLGSGKIDRRGDYWATTNLYGRHGKTRAKMWVVPTAVYASSSVQSTGDDQAPQERPRIKVSELPVDLTASIHQIDVNLAN